MLRNYIRITFRSLLRFKAFAMINLLGLALGLTTGIFILMYVLDELSFDKFHANADRIYRVGTDMTDTKTGALNGSIEANGWPIGALLKKDYPEVESIIYLRNGSDLVINHEGKRFEQKLYFASEDFFRMFSFPLKEGNPAEALSQPNTVVISESMEKKYFGEQEALGKTLTFADTLSFLVTGVMKDVPEQSHMQFDVLVSFKTYPILHKDFTFDDGWGNLNVRNYVMLKEGVNKANFFSNARNLYMNYVKDDMKKYGMYMYLGFEPLKDIYLTTKRGNGMGSLGSLERVYMVSGIAAFVLLLACINFVNLATARSVYRAKEVGLRKVVGSSRFTLIKQFLGESFILTFISFLISLALVGLLFPLFNQLIGKNYDLNMLLNSTLLVGVVALVIVVSLLSGYYPAMILSALKPSDTLKGKMQSSTRGVQLRRGLVVFQFMISAVLIICTFIVQDQLSFMKNQTLGFAGEQVVVLDITKVSKLNSLQKASFKNELKQLAAVDEVTFTNAVPGKPGWVGQWAHAEEKSADETIGVEYMSIDENYLNTLKLQLVAGRNFDPARPAEISEGLILNEEAVKQFGWEAPEKALGKKITSPSGAPEGTVIGVVKDYHEFGLQQKIYPMTMAYRPQHSRYFAIKFHASKTDELLSSLQATWKKHFTDSDFLYFFLNENFEHSYRAENLLAKVFTVFSIMTILIAIIGLVGLVSFMVVSKTKEIGIRKVLGADVLSIARMLSKEFLLLVILANLIACPLAGYFASQWLEKFAYRTTIGPLFFVVTIVTGVLITLIAISFQTIKAAMINPVNSLRSE